MGAGVGRMTMRRGALAAVLASAAMSAAASARAADPPSFPPALDAESVRSWLVQETGAASDAVIAISPSAVTRLVSASAGPGGRRSVVIEAQALTPEAVARSGVIAWRMSLEADCGTGQVRVGPTSGYLSRSATGPGVPLRPAETAWRKPAPGAQLDSILQAACASRLAAAKAAAPTPETSPAAAPAAKPAAPKPPAPRMATPAADETSDAAAQVISTPQMAEAAKLLGRLPDRFAGPMAGRTTKIVPAELRGRTVYRGLVIGFANRKAASEFCAALAARRQSCLARQAPPGRPLKPVATR